MQNAITQRKREIINAHHFRRQPGSLLFLLQSSKKWHVSVSPYPRPQRPQPSHVFSFNLHSCLSKAPLIFSNASSNHSVMSSSSDRSSSFSIGLAMVEIKLKNMTQEIKMVFMLMNVGEGLEGLRSLERVTRH